MQEEDGKEVEVEERYSDKIGLKDILYSKNGNIKFDDVFRSDSRIGINRDHKTGKVEDDNFYKQVFYQLKDGYKFAFVVEFEERFIPKSTSGVVELGGDSSKFALQMEKLDENGIEQNRLSYPKPDNTLSVTLLSDSFMDDTTIDHAHYFITETLPFRSFAIPVDNANGTYYNDNKEGRLSLFKRGSLFFFKDEKCLNAFKTGIDNLKYQTIGYNQYQINNTK